MKINRRKQQDIEFVKRCIEWLKHNGHGNSIQIVLFIAEPRPWELQAKVHIRGYNEDGAVMPGGEPSFLHQKLYQGRRVNAEKHGFDSDLINASMKERAQSAFEHYKSILEEVLKNEK